MIRLFLLCLTEVTVIEPKKKKISVASRLKNDKGWMDTYHKTNNKFEYTITSEKRTLTVFTQANGRRDPLSSTRTYTISYATTTISPREPVMSKTKYEYI